MNVLFIVPAMYPFGWAYASRALNISRLLVSSGYKVTVICDYLSDGIEINEPIEYEGVELIISSKKYASQRNMKDKLLVTVTMKKTIQTYLESHKVDYIICAMTGGKYSMVQKVANRYRIPLILEICEWYSYKNWTFGKKDPRYWKFQWDWKYNYPKAKKVLCISRLLTEHFSRPDVATARIPTILDTKQLPCKKPNELHTPIKLVFIGGITGGKDELSTLIEIVCNENLPFEIDIYGPSEKAVQTTLEGIKINDRNFRDKVHTHGFVEQQLIENIILDSDYGILIRPQRRSSNAGFPTKLAEYFSAGLPVIANNTGDVCLYLKDRENGILLENNDREAIYDALKDIMLIDEKAYEKMSECARKTAELSFDYREYIQTFNALITSRSK